MHTATSLDAWADKVLPDRLKAAVQSHGKPNPRIQFSGQLVFHHILPHLLDSKFLSDEDCNLLAKTDAGPLIETYLALQNDYADVDISDIQGFTLYEGALDETELNK